VALLLSGGRLGDMLGRKLVWQLGLGLFTLGSVLCGLAPTIAALIGFRALGVDYTSGSGIDAFRFNEVLYGPIIGVSFRF
jgi:MFS family permease